MSDKQSTDSINSAPMVTGKRVEDALRKSSLGSAQAIAGDRSDQNTVSGSGDGSLASAPKSV